MTDSQEEVDLGSENANQEIQPIEPEVEAEPPKQTEYLVRLLWKLPADTPYGAVLAAIDQVNTNGLKVWTWRVQDWDSEVIQHMDGYGNDIDVDGG